MNLVEVAPILKAVAREHRVACESLRNGTAPLDARVEAMRALRSAGISLTAIGTLFGLDHTTVLHHVGPGGVTSGELAAHCLDCGLRPIALFDRDPRKASGRKSYCRRCAAGQLRRSRAGQVGYRRRMNGRPRHKLTVEIADELSVVLHDTAARHRVSLAQVVEGAVARAMACKDCGRRLRVEGSDYCAACDAPWLTEVSA